VAPNCGYIVFKDRRDVIFYTNDLAGTPQELVVIGNADEHAIHCVNGLAKLHRWTDDSMLHRRVFMAPATIVAYNLFMNAVDRMDQRRQPVACQRREKRVNMSVFTMIMDLACSNGYAVSCALSLNYKEKVTFREFKRRVADQMTSPWVISAKQRRQKRTAGQKRKRTDPDTEEAVDDAILDPLTSHILSDNALRKDGYRKDSECYLCAVMGKQYTGIDTKKTKMGCFKCQQCYHLKCFNLRHHRQWNSPQFNTAMDLAISGAKTKRVRKDNVLTDPTKYKVNSF
jgi:hypothetical protein